MMNVNIPKFDHLYFVVWCGTSQIIYICRGVAVLYWYTEKVKLSILIQFKGFGLIVIISVCIYHWNLPMLFITGIKTICKYIIVKHFFLIMPDNFLLYFTTCYHHVINAIQCWNSSLKGLKYCCHRKFYNISAIQFGIITLFNAKYCIRSIGFGSLTNARDLY